MLNGLLTLGFLGGVVAVSYGAWLAWAPAGWLVAGVLLMVIPVVYVRGAWVSSTG